MTYTVKAPLVIIPNVDGESGDWYGYQGAIVPDGLNDERCKQLVGEGFLVKGTATDTTDEEPEGPREGTADYVLAQVGDDPVKAQAALEEEKTGKNRSSLVKKLESIVAGSGS